MARGHTAQRVGFSQEVESCRQPRDDELSVMAHYAKHARRCNICADPYDAYQRDIPLCDRGHALAMDVANYVYGKGSKPFSIIDKKQEGASVRLEVPAGYEVINDLCRAFCKGMVLRKREKPREKPIIVAPKREKVEAEVVEKSPRASYYSSQRDQDKTPRKKEYVVDERPREVRFRDYNVVEITPGSSRRERKEKVYYNDREDRTKSERRERPKSVSYLDRKGSLYERDEEEKRLRKVYEDQPIVIVAEPRRYIRR